MLDKKHASNYPIRLLFRKDPRQWNTPARQVVGMYGVHIENEMHRFKLPSRSIAAMAADGIPEAWLLAISLPLIGRAVREALLRDVVELVRQK